MFLIIEFTTTIHGTPSVIKTQKLMHWWPSTKRRRFTPSSEISEEDWETLLDDLVLNKSPHHAVLITHNVEWTDERSTRHTTVIANPHEMILAS